MKMCSIASGSDGNCVYLETEELSLIIDAGLSGKQIQDLLVRGGINPKKLDAILVTHEHADHIKGVGVLSRRFHIPIFANMETWRAMYRKIGNINTDMRMVFKNRQTFRLKDLEIKAVPLHHDAADPVGYTFTSKDEKASLITDTGFPDSKMMDDIANSDIYYFEANHDVEMLLKGPYPEDLKARILSDRGHLSNRQAGLALSELLRGKDEVVLLAHLSDKNNNPRICRSTVCQILNKQGFDTESNMKIIPAPRWEPSSIYTCIYANKSGPEIHDED